MMYAALWTEWVADSFVWNHRLERGWTKNDLVGTTSARLAESTRIGLAPRRHPFHFVCRLPAGGGAASQKTLAGGPPRTKKRSAGRRGIFFFDGSAPPS